MSAVIRAVELATRNVERAQRPYGALIVRDGVVLAEGVNEVLALGDPTAHAEVQAIRAACRGLGTETLSGAVLYASCEPCAFCTAAAQLVDIREIVHAGQCASGLVVEWPDIEVRHELVDGHTRPFELMRSLHGDLNAGRRRQTPTQEEHP